MSGDGSIVKAEKDYSKEVDGAVPDAEKLAQVYKLAMEEHRSCR